MKKEIGLWIDHREAVLVVLDRRCRRDQAYHLERRKTYSLLRPFPLQNPGRIKEVTAEDQRDRKFGNELNKYYNEVIAAVRDADTIQIFGPGEAKGELKKRIERDGLKAHILVIETVDKMTDRQIAAKVREHFLAESAAVK